MKIESIIPSIIPFDAYSIKLDGLYIFTYS